ncbi:hypothetical protein Hypma_002796 [Hypsizygus marmoreus]|uniref:Protein kinase domain-containing protein n=1 Tax=Hypsizygus marmoreus TaxID=39966 RepID=A0A369J3I5_HYPMA|nr:hypothetical protein Hypma_002796 [Hypsizygus marmoreus]
MSFAKLKGGSLWRELSNNVGEWHFHIPRSFRPFAIHRPLDMSNHREFPPTSPINFAVISCTTIYAPDTPKGVDTITFWVRIRTQETAICICAPYVSSIQELQLPNSEIFATAVQLALRERSTGVYIDDNQNVASFDPIPAPLEPVPGLSYPGHVRLPIYDANTLVPLDVYKFNNYNVKLVELDGQLLVMKQISDDNVRALQEELDNYFRAQNSPYVLPLHGMVRVQQCYVESETLRIQTRDTVTGFLLPFLGILSTWLIGGEWSVEEKEFLAITLLDAVLDLERRGVHLSDLKRDNILLALDGLKIIDLSSTAFTPGYNDFHNGITEASAKWTPYGLGRVFAELFLEGHPSHTGYTFIHSDTPAPFVEIIKRCCSDNKEFLSAEHLWYVTATLLEPIRKRAHSQGITISRLANERWLRIQNDARSWEELHLGQTRNEYGNLTSWLPHFAQESHRRWFVTPECDEAERWADCKSRIEAILEDFPVTTNLFTCLCSQDHHYDSNGERLKTYWIAAAARERAICVCTPLLYCEERLPESEIFHLAVKSAIDGGFVGVYIADDNSIFQFDTFPTPTQSPPRPAKAGLKIPDGIDLPIVDEDNKGLIYRDLLIFRNSNLRLVELYGVSFVCKSFDQDPGDLQDELDHYIQLRSSPHILHLEGLVRINEHRIDPQTFCIETWSRISGILLPFYGAWSRWWIGGEWTVTEKEYMAVKLLDTVLAIQRSGVYLEKLSRDNIFLTGQGLQIDGSSMRSGHSSRNPSAQTVLALGKAFAELFLERHPSVGARTYIAATTPPLFVDIIKRCCANQRTRCSSVEDLYAAFSGPLREIRSWPVSTAGLEYKRTLKLSHNIPRDCRQNLGQTAEPEPQLWVPSWAADILSRYWEPPESHEAELWIDEEYYDNVHEA